jgi:hypothetical protein
MLKKLAPALGFGEVISIPFRWNGMKAKQPDLHLRCCEIVLVPMKPLLEDASLLLRSTDVVYKIGKKFCSDLRYVTNKNVIKR